jgi:hypothetical protein
MQKLLMNTYYHSVYYCEVEHISYLYTKTQAYLTKNYCKTRFVNKSKSAMLEEPDCQDSNYQKANIHQQI